MAQRQSVGELLSSAHPSLDKIRELKEYARALALNTSETLPTEIASALYYLAIAAALVRCGERITKSSNSVLRRGWTLLKPQPILSADLVDLVDQALLLVDESSI